LYEKCITLYLLVALSNLFFVILRLLVMTAHLRKHFYTVNLLHLNQPFRFVFNRSLM